MRMTDSAPKQSAIIWATVIILSLFAGSTAYLFSSPVYRAYAKLLPVSADELDARGIIISNAHPGKEPLYSSDLFSLVLANLEVVAQQYKHGVLNAAQPSVILESGSNPVLYVNHSRGINSSRQISHADFSIDSSSARQAETILQQLVSIATERANTSLRSELNLYIKKTTFSIQTQLNRAQALKGISDSDSDSDYISEIINKLELELELVGKLAATAFEDAPMTHVIVNSSVNDPPALPKLSTYLLVSLVAGVVLGFSLSIINTLRLQRQ